MVLSLLARRATLGAIASVVARTTCPATLSVATRRTLFATPRFSFPPTKAYEKETENITHNTIEENVAESNHAIPAKKRGRPSKEPGECQKKQPKKLKNRLRVPKDLMPPKRAPGPYLIFFSSFLKSQSRWSSLEDSQALAKRASAVWKGYSMAEKQPFYDESEARKAQARKEREEFFSNKSLSDLRLLNSIRRAQGKPKYRSVKKSSRVPPFALFAKEFRNSPDAQALIESTEGSNHLVRTVIAAASRWRSMSAEEKAPYFERCKSALEESKAEHVDS